MVEHWYCDERLPLHVTAVLSPSVGLQGSNTGRVQPGSGEVLWRPWQVLPTRLPPHPHPRTPSNLMSTAPRVRSDTHASNGGVHAKPRGLLAEMDASSKPWQVVSVVRQGRHPGTSSYPHTVSCFHTTRLPIGGAPH